MPLLFDGGRAMARLHYDLHRARPTRSCSPRHPCLRPGWAAPGHSPRFQVAALTEPERQVLRLLDSGLDGPEIAHGLSVS